MPAQNQGRYRRRGPSTDQIARQFFRDHPVNKEESFSDTDRIDAPFRRNTPFASSVAIGNRAIAAIQTDREIPKQVKKSAQRIIQLWEKPVAAKNAMTFWDDPDHNLATFVRDTYTNGLSTLGYANAAAIYNAPNSNNQNVVEQLFHPDTRQVAEITLQALTDAAGDLDTLRLLDAPQPDGIVVHTITDSWRDETTTANLPVRLASYDATSLGLYLRFERKYSSYVETPNGTVAYPR